MPTAETVQMNPAPPEEAPHSPLRAEAHGPAPADDGPADADAALVAQSSMDDASSHASHESEDLLSTAEGSTSSPSPANILAELDAAAGNEDAEGDGTMENAGRDVDDRSNGSTDYDSEGDDDIVIGELDAKLDPSEGRCWSCLVRLRPPSNNDNNKMGDEEDNAANADNADTNGCLCATHEHPLLGIGICAPCADRAEAAEADALDAAHTITLDDAKHGSANDPTACSWCGLSEDELAATDDRDDFPASDLVLCDACPRGVCVRCVVLSLGGDQQAWATVKGMLASDDGWKCPGCLPTAFLRELREAYHAMLSSSPRNSPGSTHEEPMDVAGEHGDDASIERLLRDLDCAEHNVDEAARRLDHPTLAKERHRLERELRHDATSLEDADTFLARAMAAYEKRWQERHDRYADTIVRVQDELEARDAGVMAGYYACRSKERGEDEEKEEGVWMDCKISADLALERRDAQEGFGKGEFRGASGYQPKDPRVLKLEPEDLNAACLNEIEDVNTVAGAIAQMQSMADDDAQKANPWRSKTGITALDIEMFEKKAVKFEEVNLGERLDLDLLEKRCTTEKDDAVATKREGAVVVRKKGTGTRVVRVVRRAESLQSFKKRVTKETTRARLSGDSREYKPQLPPVNTHLPPANMPPKAKKRAQLQRLGSGHASSAGNVSPSSHGLLIGNGTAQFEGSDIVLDVQGCAGKVSVCKPLADLLKRHQVEGLRFCWKNVCSNLFDFQKEGETGIHGAILAHNMGLGKSLQAVCLLHTLMTHPALVAPSGVDGGAGGRIIKKAMLIAPVNTLANWETEFQKWVGMDSGRNLPAVRFYLWDNQGNRKSKLKMIKEWCDLGGILCVSSERYASACKAFLDADGKKRKKASEQKPAAPLTENDLFLRKALFNPGPDIVVLDEVHSMLKSNTTNIFKVLQGLATRLRLGLTGSPIQNNLYEYYRMSSWVKPDCLGTEASFTRRFHDPIMDGMAADCSPQQAEKQESVSAEMHAILAEFVHRRDANILAKELPLLQETIIQVRQSRAQGRLYRDFRKFQRESGNKGFFKQYHALRPVANHPACLVFPEEKSRPNTPTLSDEAAKEGPGDQPRVAPDKHAWICDKCRVARFRTFEEADEHEQTCNGSYDPAAAESKGQAKKDSDELWWKSFAERAEKSSLDLKAIEHGGKIVLLLQIIAHCDAIGDKVVVFSQSLPTLSYIEEVLNHPDWMGFKFYLPDNVRKQKLGGWKKDQEYLRIDGSVDAKERGDLIDTFHADEGSAGGSQRSKLFLISTNAGGLGINLVAANRVVLFDSHWNPAVDLQAVYRCYRYGQTKPTYCYRLLAEGSMEQKIYSRAATKSSLSDFVIDEKKPERSFTKHEMDLLRVEDTWVSCEACSKWRMLPPDIPADVVENLPEQWYCKDNIYDRARSTCEAKERNAIWMAEFFERRAKRNDDDEEYLPPGASQESFAASQESQGDSGTTKVATANEQKHALLINKYTERDEVLQTLIGRAEETKTANTGKDKAQQGKFSWVSKWDFNFKETEEEESLEPVPEEEEAGANEEEPAQSPTKSATKKKKKEKSPGKKSPRKKKKETSPAKSPTKKKKEKSPIKEAFAKASSKSPRQSPRASLKSPPKAKSSAAPLKSPPEVQSTKKLRAKTPSKSDARSDVKAEDERGNGTSRQTPASNGRRRRQSLLRSSKKKKKKGSGSSSKKRKSSNESAENHEPKEKEESPPPEKKAKEDNVDSAPPEESKQESGVVDLTFDSDSD